MTRNQSDDSLDMIDRLAPLLALVGLLLGITSLLSCLDTKLTFTACGAFLGLCLAVVALVKRVYVIGILAALVCLPVLILGVVQSHSVQQYTLKVVPDSHATHQWPGGPAAKVKPPASS